MSTDAAYAAVASALKTAGDTAVLAAVGGRPLTQGGGRGWDFGLVPSDPDVTAETVSAFQTMPEVYKSKKVLLTDAVRLCNGGKHLPYNYQLTGSCVNGGYQNAAVVRVAQECVLQGRAEVFKRPFTLAAYGLSRQMNGWNTPGEGSSGDSMAKAGQQLGLCPTDDPNVPKPASENGAFVYTRQVELQYSSFRQVPEAVKAASKPFTMRYGLIATVADVVNAIRSGRPVTFAGNWGGRLQCGYKGTGENRVLWNGEQADEWNHQQSVVGHWDHPDLGDIFCVLNQWYMQSGGQLVSLHGQPGTEQDPPGSYWVGPNVVQHQLSYRFGELRSLDDFSGYTDGLVSGANI